MTPDSASLQHLHDIVLPAPPSWLPPAPGWYALGLALLLILGWLLVKIRLVRRRRRYRRAALEILGELEKELASAARYRQLLPRLAELVKRTALAAYGRSRVASLSGTAWLAFLDQTGATDLFTRGGGRLLADCSCRPDPWYDDLAPEQVAGLLGAVRHWLEKHQPAGEDGGQQPDSPAKLAGGR